MAADGKEDRERGKESWNRKRRWAGDVKGEREIVEERKGETGGRQNGKHRRRASSRPAKVGGKRDVTAAKKETRNGN